MTLESIILWCVALGYVVMAALYLYTVWLARKQAMVKDQVDELILLLEKSRMDLLEGVALLRMIATQLMEKKTGGRKHGKK